MQGPLHSPIASTKTLFTAQAALELGQRPVCISVVEALLGRVIYWQSLLY